MPAEHPYGYRYATRDPNEWGGLGSNPHEDPDFTHAMNDYGAAVRDLPVDERPPFTQDDWRSSEGEPITPDWARDDLPPEPEPVCPACTVPGCPGAYGGPCANASPSYGYGSLDAPQDFHRYGSPCPDPGCQGECGG